MPKGWDLFCAVSLVVVVLWRILDWVWDDDWHDFRV